jgi:hypothetical protein
MSAVYCSCCDHVHPASRDEQKPWRWRCLAKPIEPGFKFVSPGFSPSPPYARCEDINRDGECALYTPRRIPPEDAAS